MLLRLRQGFYNWVADMFPGAWFGIHWLRTWFGSNSCFGLALLDQGGLLGSSTIQTKRQLKLVFNREKRALLKVHIFL